jgi:hypothetical protein
VSSNDFQIIHFFQKEFIAIKNQYFYESIHKKTENRITTTLSLLIYHKEMTLNFHGQVSTDRPIPGLRQI